MLKKILFSALLVASAGGALYGTWYGIGKWGYKKIANAQLDTYKKQRPELASLLEQAQTIPVTIRGFPFHWRFEFDSKEDKKITDFFVELIKKQAEKRAELSFAKDQLDKLIDEFIKNVKMAGKMEIGLRSLWAPHPYQSNARFSFGPFRSLTVNVGYDVQGNSSAITKECVDLIVAKEGKSLCTLSSKMNSRDKSLEQEIKGKIEAGLLDQIQEALKEELKDLESPVVMELLKNSFFPFDISMQIKWGVDTNRSSNFGLIHLLCDSFRQGPVTANGECLMSFKEKQLPCKFDFSIDRPNKDNHSLNNLKVKLSFLKKDMVDFFEKMGLPPFFTPFFVEQGEQLILKVEREGEKITINDQPLKD